MFCTRGLIICMYTISYPLHTSGQGLRVYMVYMGRGNKTLFIRHVYLPQADQGRCVHACAKRVHGCLHFDSSYVHLQKHEVTVILKPCVHGRVRCVQNVHGFIESLHQSEIFLFSPFHKTHPPPHRVRFGPCTRCTWCTRGGL